MFRHKTKLIILMSLSIFTSLTLLYSDKHFNGFLASGQNVTMEETGLAKVVHETETLEIPSNVNSFVILIANEAHESWNGERHKLLTNKNGYYIPSNLILHEGTKVVFLNADAPWDTPHPHNIELVDVAGEEDNNNDESPDNDNNRTTFSTGELAYTEYSEPVILGAGEYMVENLDYDTKEGTIKVIENNQSNQSKHDEEKSLVMGAFYTPTYEVENKQDNDSNTHPGSLNYYRDVFQKNDFRIVSNYNFTYSVCEYCPGNYWPDNKSANHTLIIYETNQSLESAMVKLKELVRDNVYI